MNVYWGYGASGKSNLEYQHLYGGKSFSWIGKFCAKTKMNIDVVLKSDRIVSKYINKCN